MILSHQANICYLLIKGKGCEKAVEEIGEKLGQ